MSFIAKFPRGVLGLLGLSDGGRSIEQLSPILSGTIDLTQEYTINDWVNVDMTVAAAAAGTNVFLGVAGGEFAGVPVIVPPGECWYLHGYRGSATVPAGGALSWVPAVCMHGSAGASLIEEHLTIVPASSIAYAPSGWSGRIIPAGWGLTGLVSSVTGAFALNATVCFSRLKG